MKINYVLSKLLFVLFFLVSCNQTEVGTIQKMDVSIPSSSEVLKTSQIATDVSTIVIETPEDGYMIGELVAVVEHGRKLYVSDGNSIIMIDEEGRILKTISKKGEGPDEYLEIADIQIDEQGRLWVLSRINKTLYCYSWDDEKLIKKIVTDAWLMKMKYIGNDKMLCYIGNEMDDKNVHKLRTIDLKTGEVIQKELPINVKQAEYLHWMTRNHFSVDGVKTYFYELFCDTIYSLDDDFNLKPSKYIDIEGRGIPPSFLDEEYNDVLDFYQKLSSKGYAYGVNMYLTKGKNSLLTFIYDGGYKWFAKLDKRSLAGNALVEDVILEGYEFDNDNDVFFVEDNGVLIIALSPFLVMERMKEVADDATLERLKKKLGYLGDDQNPILLMIKL